MSIATRLEAIEEHLTNDYSVLELAGSDLTNVDKNIVNLKPTWKERLLYFINNGTDIVWDNWEKVVGEGTELTLSNTEQAPMKVLLKGNTYQDSTTGKNLYNKYGDFNYPTNSYINGTSLQANGTIKTVANAQANASRGIRLSLKQNTTYVISGNLLSSTGSGTSAIARVRAMGYTSNWTEQGGRNLNATGTFSFSFNTGNATDWFISLNANGTTGTSYEAIYDEIQVEEGSSATSYEPYTNGASPNPDYPQEVHVVSGDNEVEVSNGDNTQSTTYPINLPEGMFLGSIGDYKDRFFKTSGNNLFDEQYELGTIDNAGQLNNSKTIIMTKNYQKIEPSTQYSIKVPNEVTGMIFYYYNNGTFISLYQPIVPTNKVITFTSVSDANQVKWRFNSNYTTLENQTMLVKGGTILPYEPYGSNEWYLEKKIGEVVLEGSSVATLGSGLKALISYSATNKINQGSVGLFYEKAKFVNVIENIVENTIFENAVNVIVAGNSADTLDTLKAKFDGGLLFYVLATPTYTKIEGTLASQLEAVYRAKSEEGQTNISQTNDDLPFVLSVSALSQEV